MPCSFSLDRISPIRDLETRIVDASLIGTPPFNNERFSKNFCKPVVFESPIPNSSFFF